MRACAIGAPSAPPRLRVSIASPDEISRSYTRSSDWSNPSWPASRQYRLMNRTWPIAASRSNRASRLSIARSARAGTGSTRVCPVRPDVAHAVASNAAAIGSSRVLRTFAPLEHLRLEIQRIGNRDIRNLAARVAHRREPRHHEARIRRHVELRHARDDLVAQRGIEVHRVRLDELPAGFVVAFRLDALHVGQQPRHTFPERADVHHDVIGPAVAPANLDRLRV